MTKRKNQNDGVKNDVPDLWRENKYFFNTKTFNPGYKKTQIAVFVRAYNKA